MKVIPKRGEIIMKSFVFAKSKYVAETERFELSHGSSPPTPLAGEPL